jgi:hypothetical protein
MLYGPAKRRQMARSLLPSTARRGAARDLAAVRRRNRRQVAEHLAGLTGTAAGAAARWEDSGFDERSWPQRQIKDAVWDRRGHDKVAPYQRWAVAVTAHAAAPDRMDAMRRAVPPGLMGRHALSHIECLDHFSGHLCPHCRSFGWMAMSPAPVLDHRAELRAVVAEGRLAEFNRWMKRPEFGREGSGPAWRTLLGEHDVDAFLDDCLGVVGRGGRRRVGVAAPDPWLDGIRGWAHRERSGR